MGRGEECLHKLKGDFRVVCEEERISFKRKGGAIEVTWKWAGGMVLEGKHGGPREEKAFWEGGRRQETLSRGEPSVAKEKRKFLFA